MKTDLKQVKTKLERELSQNNNPNNNNNEKNKNKWSVEEEMALQTHKQQLRVNSQKELDNHRMEVKEKSEEKKKEKKDQRLASVRSSLGIMGVGATFSGLSGGQLGGEFNPQAFGLGHGVDVATQVSGYILLLNCFILF